MAKPEFIGKNNLTHIADQFAPQIAMGASYFRPEEMTRLGIHVISGVQFKNTKTIMARKGGTTRRKVVGTPVENKIGFLKERPLVAKLTWNRFRDNRDNYVETPYPVEGSSDFSYPLSEVAFLAITATYGEDLFLNLFHGNLQNDENGPKGALSLLDGYHTLVSHDIEDGIISEAMGNLIPCDAISAPVDDKDIAAWLAVEKWIQKWNPSLKSQKEVLIYCDTTRASYIETAYANKWHGNKGVTYVDGTINFKVTEHPNITFAPSDVYGEGERLMATVKDNLEYGVNTLDSRTKISVREGSDDDAEDIIFQVQSIQGCRILNPLSSSFAVSTAAITDKLLPGDYQKANLVVTSNDEKLGTVQVDGAKNDPTKEYAPNTSVTLKAVKTGTNKFVRWSNGKTEEQITIVTDGYPMALMAIFSK